MSSYDIKVLNGLKRARKHIVEASEKRENIKSELKEITNKRMSGNLSDNDFKSKKKDLEQSLESIDSRPQVNGIFDAMREQVKKSFISQAESGDRKLRDTLAYPLSQVEFDTLVAQTSNAMDLKLLNGYAKDNGLKFNRSFRSLEDTLSQIDEIKKQMFDNASRPGSYHERLVTDDIAFNKYLLNVFGEIAENEDTAQEEQESKSISDRALKNETLLLLAEDSPSLMGIYNKIGRIKDGGIRAELKSKARELDRL